MGVDARSGSVPVQTAPGIADTDGATLQCNVATGVWTTFLSPNSEQIRAQGRFDSNRGLCYNLEPW